MPLASLAPRSQRRPEDRDAGFTLLEAVVALMIATISFTALAAAGLTAIRGTTIARTNQQSADLLAKQIETVRSYDYDSATHDPTDPTLAGDSAITNCGGDSCYDPGTGPETLAIADDGLVNPHRQTLPRAAANNYVDYTITTYVTTPVDSTGADYRRVTVTISWTQYGKTRTRTMSTIITYNERGLPLPVYKVTAIGATTQTVNPTAQVAYGFTVQNQGAPDRFSIAPSGSDSWSYFKDNGDGAWDPSTDTAAVTDTDADGTVDTDRMDPSSSLTFWMVRTVGPVTGTTTTTVTFTSVAQPLADTAVVAVSVTTVVQTGVVTATPTTGTSSGTGSGSASPSASPSPTAADCGLSGNAPTAAAAAGYTLKQYVLRNASGSVVSGADSTAQPLLDLSTAGTGSASLFNYSTDLSTSPGRVVETGGAFPTVVPSKVVDWRIPVGKKAWSGTATMDLWVAAVPGTPVSSVTLTAYVYKYESGTATSMGTITFSVPSFSCAGFQKVSGSTLLNQIAKLGNSGELGVRLVNAGSAPVRIAYDTSTYAANIIVPEK